MPSLSRHTDLLWHLERAVRADELLAYVERELDAGLAVVLDVPVAYYNLANDAYARAGADVHGARESLAELIAATRRRLDWPAIVERPDDS